MVREGGLFPKKGTPGQSRWESNIHDREITVGSRRSKMQGRKPKPTLVKINEGNKGKNVLVDNDLKLQPSKDITPPPFLDKLAKDEWNRLVKDMTEQGIYTMWDRATMSAYCMSYSEWLNAKEYVDAMGQTVPNSTGGFKLNPMITVMRQYRSDCVKYAAILGFNPSDRVRLKGAAPAGDTSGDDFGE